MSQLLFVIEVRRHLRGTRRRHWERDETHTEILKLVQRWTNAVRNVSISDAQYQQLLLLGPTVPDDWLREHTEDSLLRLCTESEQELRQKLHGRKRHELRREINDRVNAR